MKAWDLMHVTASHQECRYSRRERRVSHSAYACHGKGSWPFSIIVSTEWCAYAQHSKVDTPFIDNYWDYTTVNAPEWHGVWLHILSWLHADVQCMLLIPTELCTGMVYQYDTLLSLICTLDLMHIGPSWWCILLHALLLKFEAGLKINNF